MRSVLAILIALDGEFGRTEIEVLSAGRRLASDLGGSLSAAVVGPAPAAWTEAAVANGATRVYLAGDAALSAYQPALFAEAVRQAAAAAGADVLLFPSTTSGLELAPLSAYKLQASAVMDVVGLDGKVDGGGVRIQKPVFGGKAQSVLLARKGPLVVALRMRSVDPMPRIEGAQGESIPVALSLPASGSWKL